MANDLDSKPVAAAGGAIGRRQFLAGAGATTLAALAACSPSAVVERVLANRFQELSPSRLDAI